MIKNLLAASALAGLAACSGGDFLFVPDGDDGGGDSEPVETGGIPESLAQNLKSITFNPGSGSVDPTLTVEITSLDTTPVKAVYERRPSLDLPGFQAFAVQEDALDRLFVALVGQSADDTTEAGVVADGGQFNKVFQGAYYKQNGAYSAPDATGDDPGKGQVSYAGNYVGITNIGGTTGPELKPVPPGTDPSLIPHQALRVAGTGFVNANFADMTVNGAIYGRVLVDTGLGLESVILAPTAITDEGTFFGDTERPKTPDILATDIGDYGGVFGGVGATSLSGILSLTQLYDTDGERIPGAIESGVFVLDLCGGPSNAAICDAVAP